MPILEIDEQDVSRAKRLMVAFLTERHPDADFSPGSVTHDHTVGALAAMYAYFRAELERSRQLASVRRINEIEDDEEYNEGVLNLLSTFFIQQRPGTRVRGEVTVHFSQVHDGVIPLGTQFAYQATIIYELDATSPVTYTASDLIPNVGADGVVEDYLLRVPVIAREVGAAYRVQAGVLSSVSRFSVYQTYAEFEEDLVGGTEPPTPAELLLEAGTAISTRDLTSKRSIAYLLQNQFPDIDRILIYGMGDEGMLRDITDDPDAFYKVHRGGHVDVYVGLPIENNRVHEATVGAPTVDERSKVVLFRDENVDDWRTVVEEGAVLHIRNASTTEPALYLIRDIQRDFLRVEPYQPFPEARPTIQRNGTTYSVNFVTAPDQLRNVNAQFSSADIGRWVRIENATNAANNGVFQITAVNSATDTVTLDTSALVTESGTAMTFTLYDGVVVYSVGDNPTGYDNQVSESSTGEFSRVYSRSGEIVMPFSPFYTVRSVEVYAPTDPAAGPTGYVSFSRSSKLPNYAESGGFEYQVIIENYKEAYSTRQFARVILHTEPIATGTRGILSATNRLTVDTATFTASHVGKMIRMSNAFYANNRGEMRVASVISPTVVELSNPRDASWVATAEGRVHWELSWPDRFDDKTCRVTYDGLHSFDSVATFAQDPERRNSSADLLVRAFIPIYLSFELRYTLRGNATALLDEEAAKQTLVEYVNNFPVDDVIDVTDITTAFQNIDGSVIGSIELPLTITYSVQCPDGRVAPFATQDRVTLSSTKSTAVYDEEAIGDAPGLGITDENVRYLTRTDLITLTQI